jgi:hypothetical protein
VGDDDDIIEETYLSHQPNEIPMRGKAQRTTSVHFRRDDSAISVVLGTILMVILAIILIGVLLIWVMSFVTDLPGSPLEDDDESDKEALHSGYPMMGTVRSWTDLQTSGTLNKSESIIVPCAAR